MQDTPDHIKKIQSEIWLSKPPMERLKQFLIDNDTLYQFWRNARSHQKQHDQNKSREEPINDN
jgi:hypothetical protein